MRRLLLASALLAATLSVPSDGSPPRPWEQYIYAPASRTVQATSVVMAHRVQHASALLGNGVSTLTGKGAEVVLDFGRDVGGLISFDVSRATAPIGLAFSESSLFVGPVSDSSTGRPGSDGAITAIVSAGQHYDMPAALLRGGFRYLTLFLSDDGTVSLSRLRLHFTPAPDLANPRDYPNHFFSSDPVLNRIWYAGTYTAELDTVGHDQGRFFPFPATGWDNSASLAPSGAILVDGAKRDRALWPGDLGVSVPTSFVGLHDLAAIRNSLDVLYAAQLPDGAFPYAGPRVDFPGGTSDTYHLWTLIATEQYVRYSHDLSWLRRHWGAYVSGLDYSLREVLPTTGLMYVVGSADWARTDQGKENIAANSLLYGALRGAAELADLQHVKAGYDQKATRLRHAINERLWDQHAGAYRDNPDEKVLHPQDGNALAVWLGVADAQRSALAMRALRRNWLARGAHTPEWKGIHPFPGSLEVLARFAAFDDVAALALIRREWGYMLTSPLGTRSTFWEGYLDDGSLGYEGMGAGYTSLAHGWATGPTSALTFYLVGITPQPSGGWLVRPHPGDVQSAEGSLTVPSGVVDVSWRQGRTFELTVTAKSAGEVDVPGGARSRVLVDDRPWEGARWDGRYLRLLHFPKGTHRVRVT